MKRYTMLSVIISIITANALYATEYFLGVSGNDTHPGTTEAQPLATINRAIQLLHPGDTLTILPGEYHQDALWEFPGSDTAVTTIRVKIPGSVHFRGDVPAPSFQPADASRVYVCTVEKIPEQVIERDTLTKYTNVPSQSEVAFTPGSSYFDKENHKVYIHTTNGSAPENHQISFSTLHNAICIIGDNNNAETPVRNLIIDGLTISAYNSNIPLSGSASSIGGGGIYIRRPVNVVIRNCTVYLSGGGIILMWPTACDIDDCLCFYNDNDFSGSGGNIICFNPTVKTRIRRCIAFGSRHSGIRMYGGTPAENSLIEDCIVYDNAYGDIWLKYPSDTSVARRCFVGKTLHSRLIENSIFTSGDSYYFGKANNSIARSREKAFKPEEQFADPGRFDFRLQSDSMFRNPERGIAPFDPKVLFVSPTGNDTADGNSIKSAIKTFKAAVTKLTDGGTLYILPGKYTEPLHISGKKNLLIRGRGNVPAILNGEITLSNCLGATVENLNLLDPVHITDSDDLTLKNCGVRNPVKFTSQKLTLLHNTFIGAVEVSSPDAAIRSNIFVNSCQAPGSLIIGSAFAGTIPDNSILCFQETPQFTAPDQFTLKNAGQFDGRAIDGMPVGAFQRIQVITGQKPELTLNSFSTTTANFSFFSSNPSTLHMTADKKRVSSPDANNFHTLSFYGLKPDTKYEYQLRASFSPLMRFTTAAAEPHRTYQTKGSFSTAAADQPVIWHVATNGDNQASGLSREDAWRNISHAVLKAKAGDTVQIHGGNYLEKVRVGTTGDNGQRFTIKATPGEKVFLDGGALLSQGFVLSGKSHVSIDEIRFAGFKNDHSKPTGGIVARDCPELLISRCFYDGRQPPRYAPPFINARNCINLTMENCVVLRGFSGFRFERCHNLLVRNNVFVRNQVLHGGLSNSASATSRFHHNIFAGHDLQKTHNPVINMDDIAGFQEDNNCFMVRLPAEMKPIFGVRRNQGERLPHNNDISPRLTEEWRRQGRFGNDIRSYPEFCKRYQRPQTSLFVNAGMKALNSFYQFKDVEDWYWNFIKRKSSTEQRAAYRQANQNELSLEDNGSAKPLDFSDFFSTHPEVMKRGIGLQPDAFKN
jgi:hypothetical protein